MDCVQPAVAEPLLQGLTRIGTPARAVGDDDAVGIGFPDRLCPALDQEAVTRLALAQGRFRAKAASHLVTGHVDVGDAALHVPHGCQPCVEHVGPNALAARVERLSCDLHGLACESALVEGSDRRPALRKDIRQRMAESARIPVAVEPGGGVVVDQNPRGSADEARHERSGEDLLDHHLETIRPPRDRPERCRSPLEVANAGGHLTIAAEPSGAHLCHPSTNRAGQQGSTDSGWFTPGSGPRDRVTEDGMSASGPAPRGPSGTPGGKSPAVPDVPGGDGSGSGPRGRGYPSFIRSSIARSTFSRAP